MENQNLVERLKSIAARSGIIVFFIIAFEVMIMISPFAFFFYSVFNPVLHAIESSSATRWLTGFFLPHMILPPTLFLKTIRVLGSVLFVGGAMTFTVCALQVYLGKIFKWGMVDQGLYRVIRHPQYLALGLWGIGMSILWPRFLVLASLSLMFILYRFLAKDEERRMLNQFGDKYRTYMERTGMFLPRSIEVRLSAPFGLIPHRLLRHAVITLQHSTVALITDWVLNPFEHLRRSPSAHMAKMHGVDPAVARRHHCPLGLNDPVLQCEACPFRRIIFVAIKHGEKGHLSKEDLFSFDATRAPTCFIDMNVRTGEIIRTKRVEKSTAWGDVPTPAI
jgi:protein-S-isoprenylcysteine O-methyltransferase Ste14